MLGNRDPGALQRHAGHERRLVNAEPGGGPLNLLLDVRPGALLHPRRFGSSMAAALSWTFSMG